ncbi:MAG: orotidine 5'-phosphate decarboxylase / HUMPS family protein [Nitrososphaeraceae archaeon]
MNNAISYRKRIEYCSKSKNSKIVLALDPIFSNNVLSYLDEKIILLQEEICAIKFNFHVILPLSLQELSNVNSTIHSYGLQSIADIKLNDISYTNVVVINQLVSMGFDAVIVNPIIGMDELSRVIGPSHHYNLGVITLVYMSHAGAREGFGLNVVDDSRTSNHESPLYQRLLQYSENCDVDGIIVGGTKVDIINRLSREKKLPIYSPGLGVQGGDPKIAAKAGTDYFIIGRSITQSRDSLKSARLLRKQINSLKED